MATMHDDRDLTDNISTTTQTPSRTKRPLESQRPTQAWYGKKNENFVLGEGRKLAVSCKGKLGKDNIIILKTAFVDFELSPTRAQFCLLVLLSFQSDILTRNAERMGFCCDSVSCLSVENETYVISNTKERWFSMTNNLNTLSCSLLFLVMVAYFVTVKELHSPRTFDRWVVTFSVSRCWENCLPKIRYRV